MQDVILPLVVTATFGAIIGTLYRFSRRPGYRRPLLFPMVGLAAGIIGFVIYRLLVATTGAPLWLLPLLVVVQIWLWLGPLGPARAIDQGEENKR